MTHFLVRLVALLRSALTRETLPPPPVEAERERRRGLLALLFAREPLPRDPAPPARQRGAPMEHARHVVRVVLLVMVVLAVAFLARGFLVPRSYGMYGPYRYDNVREQMNVRRPAHAGPAACEQCHPDEATARKAGVHRNVSCEVCHGPFAAHVKEDGSVVTPTVDRSYTLCARCHRKVDGRPAGFPQVVLEEHVSGPVEGKVCLGCHNPHSPKL